jgi:hypothetical protein
MSLFFILFEFKMFKMIREMATLYFFLKSEANNFDIVNLKALSFEMIDKREGGQGGVTRLTFFAVL